MIKQEIREQLSALIDNELDRDQARFLLKRAEHDDELVALWQRWHFVGEVMRGAALPLRKDFAQQISARLRDDEPQPRDARPSTRLLRWGGGFAVAASVALAALLFTQPGTMTGLPDAGEASLAAGQTVPGSDLVEPSVVAASPYREQDLRPSWRFDAQVVSLNESERSGTHFRLDPMQEAQWLQYQHNRGAGLAAPIQVPLRLEAMEPVPAH